ncbi:hypothetical protein BSLA_03r0471 [Burkholderia stabilis]|nr:hypothetical protein BSLA_03r0471 [Burkholderia stabilis]
MGRADLVSVWSVQFRRITSSQPLFGLANLYICIRSYQW